MATVDTVTMFEWPKSPYKGLSYYGPNDVPLLAGRKEAVQRCARQLADRKTRLLILQGRTGCGKSSFLRAGLIPFLERQRGRYQFARADTMSPEALFVRSTDAPLKALAAEVYKFVRHAVIETTDGEERLDQDAVLLGCTDAVAFVEQAGNSGELLIRSLKAIAAEWPRSLALIIDQGEEVLTLKSGPQGNDARAQFFDFVYRFSKTDFDLKLILAIRTEDYGEFAALMSDGKREPTAIQFFYLDVLGAAHIAEAIARPTSAVDEPPYGNPFDHYHFDFEPGLPDLIASEITSNKNIRGGILPVVQIVCENLYQPRDRARRQKGKPNAVFRITTEDYRALPPVEIQLDGYLQQKLHEFGDGRKILVSDDEVDRWKNVLSGLSIAQIDGTVIKQLKDVEALRALARKAGCKLPFEDTIHYLSDPEVRILTAEEVINSATNKPVLAYSLAHDALGLVMENWKTSQIELRRRLALARRAYLVVGTMLTAIGMAVFVVNGLKLTTGSKLILVYGAVTLATGVAPKRFLTIVFRHLIHVGNQRRPHTGAARQ